MSKLQEEVNEIREMIDRVKWYNDSMDPRIINRNGNFYRNPEKEIYRAFVPTEKNPISMDFSNYQQNIEPILNEAIAMTYPIETVKKWLYDIYVEDKFISFGIINDSPSTFVCGLVIPDVTDIETRDINVVKENKDFKKLVRALSLCGYFLSFCQLPEGKNYVMVQFEPLFEPYHTVFSLKEKGIKFLWHLSPDFYKEKILKIGLCPYSRNEKFNYPDRVYFLLPKLNDKEIKRSAGELEQARRQGKGNTNKNYIKTDTYTKYIIDINKLDDTMTFFEDGNASNALYTKENVPPTAIVGTSDFKIKIID